MKKNDKKYTIANAAGFIFPVTTVYMAIRELVGDLAIDLIAYADMKLVKIS